MILQNITFAIFFSGMSKFIGNNTIVEHKGLAKLKTFCANHIPFLLCRDETITDVGIDGEIEICLKNADGKTEATGERIKFQLKSTESDQSYIRAENDIEFSFYASKNDLEYWIKHQQDVLLIIYDVRNNVLYAKKITKHDFNTQSLQKRLPIYFNKKDCELTGEQFDFHNKFSTAIKERLNFDTKEPASSNIFRIKKHPKLLYQYLTDFTNKESVYKSLPDKSIILPQFILYDQNVFTFCEPKNQSEYFQEHIIKSEDKQIFQWKDVKTDKIMRNHYSELLRIYLKQFFGSKGIYLNKEHNRFYFGIRQGEAERSIQALTRKRGILSAKQVVKFYSYGKYQFFKHHAFAMEFIHSEDIYVCFTPTYLITADGKNPVDGKTASKFINWMKRREYNPDVANHIQTIFSFLAGKNEDITVSNPDNLEIMLSSWIPFTLPFSIPTDRKGFDRHIKRETKIKVVKSQTILFNE